MGPPPPDIPSALAARFQVLGTLGAGSYGRVLRVRERASGRGGALKLVALQRDGARELREARAAAELEDPGLVTVHDSGIVEDQLFLFMELAEGSLVDLLDPPGQPAALRRLAEAGRGLAALHRAGLVHRDVKPGNILLVGGRGKLADLGLARGADWETLTEAGIVLGTPETMAPEQAQGLRTGPEADLFALGAVAYWVLEGRRLRGEGAPGELLVRAARGEAEPFRWAEAKLGPEALAPLRRALDPDPARRGADVPGLLDALEALAAELEAPGGEAEGAPTRLLGESLASVEAQVPRPHGSAPTSGTPRGRVPGALVALGSLALALGMLTGPSTPPTSPTPEPASPQGTAGQEEAVARARARFDARLGRFQESITQPGSTGPLRAPWLAEQPPEVQDRLVDVRIAPSFGRLLEAHLAWVEALVHAGRAGELEARPANEALGRVLNAYDDARGFLRQVAGVDGPSIIAGIGAQRGIPRDLRARAQRLEEEFRPHTDAYLEALASKPGVPAGFLAMAQLEVRSVAHESTANYVGPAIEALHPDLAPEVAWRRIGLVSRALGRSVEILPMHCPTWRAHMAALLPKVPPLVPEAAESEQGRELFLLWSALLRWSRSCPEAGPTADAFVARTLEGVAAHPTLGGESTFLRDRVERELQRLGTKGRETAPAQRLRAAFQ